MLHSNFKYEPNANAMRKLLLLLSLSLSWCLPAHAQTAQPIQLGFLSTDIAVCGSRPKPCWTPYSVTYPMPTTGGGAVGTVTSVSCTTQNGVSCIVTDPTTTPALAFTLGNITPTTVNGLTLAAQSVGFTIAGGTTSKTLTVPLDATVSGTNTGDQTTSGTTNRISVSSGTTNPVIDISASYVGQASITTLGTIGTGIWNAGAVTSSGVVQGTRLISTVATGTAPLTVSSTTQVANLNAATAGTVTTNANLTGPITSVGNATSIAAQTGTGTTFVMQASPTLTGTPVLSTAQATNIAIGGATIGANGLAVTGSILFNNDLVGTSGGGFRIPTFIDINQSQGVGVIINSGRYFGWSNSTTTFTTQDTILSRPAAATVQHGAIDVDTNAAVVAQTIRTQGLLAGGTSDQAGKNFTFIVSPGKGTGVGGSFIVQTAPAGSTGTTVNSPVTALTIDSTAKALFGGTIDAGNNNVDRVNLVRFNNSADARISSGATSVIGWGSTAAASPINYTIQGQGSRAGTDSNVAGASLIYASGQGTGNSTPSTLSFQTPVAVASGTGAQTMGTRMLVTSIGVAIGSTSQTAGTALDLGTNTSSLLLPIGTTGQRPASPVNGMLRYNSDTPSVEAYQNNAWASLGAGGGTGTVTTFSCVTANGVSCSVANASTTPAATFTLGAITPTTVQASGAVTVTSNSATALTVGANGATNPAVTVDASTASSATGIKFKSAAAAGGYAVSLTSSGSNENLTLDALGSGTTNIGSVSTGAINIGSAATKIVMDQTNSQPFSVRIGSSTALGMTTAGQFLLSMAASNTASNVRFSVVNSSSDTNLTASTEATHTYFNLAGTTRTHATGALTLQRDFRITGSNHAFAGSSTLTNDAVLALDFSTGSSANGTITNLSGLYIPTVVLTGTKTNAFAINVAAPSGAGSNYAAQLDGGVVLLNQTTGTNADFLCLSSAGLILVQTSACTISSMRFKQDINPLEASAVGEIMKLEPVTFRMKDMAKPNPDPNFKSVQIGLTAENVSKVDKRLAIYENDMKTPKSYRQESVIALLVKGMQEQQKQIDALKHYGHRCFGIFFCGNT